MDGRIAGCRTTDARAAALALLTQLSRAKNVFSHNAAKVSKRPQGP